ncbi:uncharacterized protein BDCG_04893 [Blastomyces dermatitidis ER-3]|nr:uncharacterized protein BDCG_04893 [Blastomyces dermatitidis ER-3]EEQ89773.1 hypothetical protein BDCG_04893 [Blastomyces dermatitidis ER-3]
MELFSARLSLNKYCSLGNQESKVMGRRKGNTTYPGIQWEILAAQIADMLNCLADKERLVMWSNFGGTKGSDSTVKAITTGGLTNPKPSAPSYRAIIAVKAQFFFEL